MFAQTVRRISAELERLTRQNISLERAMDLLEASTSNIEELLVINTMRETLFELPPALVKPSLQPGYLDLLLNQRTPEVCHA